MNKRLGQGIRLSFAIIAFAEALFHHQLAFGEQDSFPLGRKKLMTIEDTTCGYISSLGKWKVVEAVEINGPRTYYQVKALATTEEKARCKKLPGARSITSLKKLPAPTKLTKAAPQSEGARLAVVSGVAPTLPKLSSGEVDLSTTFWSEGVIDALLDGDPSEEQCQQFWAGVEDGQSGGMAACFLTDGVGHSFSTMLMGGTSLCYMKNAPTLTNLQSGAVSLISGTLPDNDVTKLFSPPLASDRLVNVQAQHDEFGSQNIFIRIYSQESNIAEGYHYRYDLWFCNPGQDAPSEKENTSIKINGAYKTRVIGRDRENNSAFSTMITAFLRMTNDGHPVFDTSQDRRAVVAFDGGEQSSFKGDLVITSENKILFKSYESFDGEDRKGYSVAEFSGTSLENLRFLAGANRHHNLTRNETFQVATEFRDNYYAAAPESELMSELNDVDFEEDDFYSEPPSVNPNITGYSCSPQPDVVVAMDMGHEGMRQVRQTCESGNRMEGGAFCSNDETLQQAMEAWFEACQPH